MAIIGETQFHLTFFFYWLISAFLLRFLFKKHNNLNLHLPPSPTAVPFIGHLHLLRPLVAQCLHKISSKHGPLLYLRLGSRPLLLVSSAAFASEIYKTNDISFSAKPFKNSLLFGNSGFITAPYGEYWRFMKKLCMTELLGTQQLQRSHGIRREELMIFIEKLVEKVNRRESVYLGLELMKLTNNTICRMVMSARCSTEDNEAKKCRELVLGLVDLAGKKALASMLGPFKGFGYWLNRKKMEDIPKEFNMLFDKILREHEKRAQRDEDDNKDVIDILLKVYHDQNAEFKISMNQIKAFLLDLFIGGTDTSGNSMEWVMAELINHPNVLKKLRKEIESVVGTKRVVEESDVPNLHYLQAVVKETLRLHPIVPAIPRECREDCRIRGYDIPKDTAVIINAYSIMRDPDIWEHPNEFYPERFLQEKDNKNKNFSFVAFGGGRRICPGSHLALCVIHITVACMVQCFDWKVFGEGEKVNMEDKAGMVMAMARPLQCLPVLKFNPFAT